jgi:hypothetical protein
MASSRYRVPVGAALMIPAVCGSGVNPGRWLRCLPVRRFDHARSSPTMQRSSHRPGCGGHGAGSNRDPGCATADRTPAPRPLPHGAELDGSVHRRFGQLQRGQRSSRWGTARLVVEGPACESPAGKFTADSQATTAMGPSLRSWGPLRATTRLVPDDVNAGCDRQVHPLRHRPALCGPVRPRSPGR